MPLTARENCRMGRQQPITQAGLAIAHDCYNQAIQDEPGFMPAHAEHAYIFLREYQNGWSSNRAASLQKARARVDMAVSLCDDATCAFHNDFRGRWYSAMVRWNEGDFNSSFAEFETARAMITDPERIVRDTADLDADMAEAYVYSGDAERAISLIEQAMARYPEFPYWYWWNLGRAYYMAGRYTDAINAIGKIADPPNDTRLITAASEAQRGNIAIAQSIMAQFSNEDPDWSIAKSAAYSYGDPAARDHWIDGLRKAGLREVERL